MDTTAYPTTPPGWTPVARRSIGPFTTHVTYRRSDGSTLEWSSRSHRKHASRLSRAHRRELTLWAPRQASWWIAILFAAGSACFLVAPFPGFLQLVGPAVDGMVFFVGSLLFTSAAFLQWLETINANRGPEPTARRRLRLLPPRENATSARPRGGRRRPVFVGADLHVFDAGAVDRLHRRARRPVADAVIGLEEHALVGIAAPLLLDRGGQPVDADLVGVDVHVAAGVD